MGNIKFVYVKPAENWADMFTKPLPFAAHVVQSAMAWNRWSGHGADGPDENGSLKHQREEQAGDERL
jgi:hypothetical protein